MEANNVAMEVGGGEVDVVFWGGLTVYVGTEMKARILAGWDV